jgi:signal peptidase II
VSEPKGIAALTTAARLGLLALAVATVGCDRVTKHLATRMLEGEPTRSYLGDTLRVVYAENTGGFLSIGGGLPDGVRTAVFTVGTGLVLLALVVVALRRRWSGLRLTAIVLFVAGGASNWVDRALRGSVVDFLNVGLGPLRTGIFNVADMAIMLGAALLLVAELRSARASRRQR